MFTTSTVITGAIFLIPKARRVPNGPLWQGFFRVKGEHGRFEGAAWPRTVKEGENAGKDYYSLALEPFGEDGKRVKVYGAMYPELEKRSDAAADYKGWLNLTSQRGGPALRIAAWKARSREHDKRYVSVVIGEGDAVERAAEEEDGLRQEASAGSGAR